MTLKFKLRLTILIAFFSIFIFSSDLTFAQSRGCTGSGGNLQCGAAGIVQVQELMTRLINLSVTIAFMALTVWLVWNAVKTFITSGGDPKVLAHAWAAVTWAFMGIFFMVLAWLSLKLIFAVTGADVTKYCLGFPPYCI